jgi:hypothetical protein
MVDPDAEFLPAMYGEAPPDVTGRNVVILDFSYKRPVLEKMIAQANRLCILDHHKTAEAELAGLDGIKPGVEILFDMNRSGAGMTWDWFFPHEPRPKLIDHIEDRDLGGGIAFPSRLPETRAVNAVLFSLPYDFGVWDDYADRVNDDMEGIQLEAAALDRKHKADIAAVVRATRREMVIGGYRVPVANAPHMMASDACHLMNEGQPFAATYFDTRDGRAFSLRSREDGVDVSQVAKSYGGGGHARAAGFKACEGWEGDAIGTDRWEREVNVARRLPAEISGPKAEGSARIAPGSCVVRNVR